jgi:hypothetical protein
MDESKGLYFIPMIAEALKSNDPQGALREAFAKIVELGRKDEYQEGFRQFNEFVKAASISFLEKTPGGAEAFQDAIDLLIHDLATDTFEGDKERKISLIETLRRFSEWYQTFEQIKEESEDLTPPQEPLEIEVLREGEVLGSFPVAGNPPLLTPIFPGWYTLRFTNGRVLWEGEIRAEDVLWADAHPGEDLPLAAQTEATRAEPTRTIHFLEGEIEMHIFAGLEAGALRIGSENQK